MESITKQAENARKYERIFGCGVWCLTGYTNGNKEADTVEEKNPWHGGREGYMRLRIQWSERERRRRVRILPKTAHPRIWFARGSPRFDRKLYTELAVTSIVSTNRII